MLSLLAQRSAFKLPTLAARATPALLRSRAPLVATLTRNFVTTPLLAFPAAKTAKATKAAESAPETKPTRGRAKSTPAKASTKTAKTTKTTKTAKAAKPKAAPKPRRVKKEKPKRMVIRPEDRPPKAQGSPFSGFWADRCAELKGKFGESGTLQEHMRKASADWRAMTDEEKKPYFERYRARLEEFQKAREEYWANADPAVIREINRRSPKKKPLRMPSKQKGRPATPFLRFYTGTFRPSYIAEHPDAAFGEIGKAAGAAWKALSEAEKEPYQEEWKRELKEWEAKETSNA
ncbi:hypothetical protein PsYK624_164560 [Phanerochaete sordida]|uniref:HMG box domain-containing protein n=1 Tax=Phanerochaete sordida TaxID=48140 RepID=A0A9P3GS50_9APHY|nr:hypothetical protein PsYK624_164560 [Phanerochaete sordida]